MANQRGTITVFLLIILCAILLTTTMVVEVARIKIAEEQARRAVDTAIFSSLASYDHEVKEEYGLFYRYGINGLDGEVKENIEKGLLINDSSKAWKPYEYQIKHLDIRAQYPVTDKESLKHQVLEYVKYRGPVVLMDENLEKLSAFLTVQTNGQVIRKDLEVDQKAKQFYTTQQELKTQLNIINTYPSAVVNQKCMVVMAKAQELRALNEEKKRLEARGYDPEDTTTQAALQEVRSRIGEVMAAVRPDAQFALENITIAQSANSKASALMARLKALEPEIKAGINSAKSSMTGDSVLSTLKDEKQQKYQQYETYVDTTDMQAAYQNSTQNIKYLNPQTPPLKDVLSQKAPTAQYATIYSDSREGGYQAVQANTPGMQWETQLLADAQSGGVALDHSTIGALINKLQGLKNAAGSFVTADQNPVERCPGAGSGTPGTELVFGGSGGDVFDDLSGMVSDVTKKVSQDVDAKPILEGIKNGTLELDQEAYQTLLINEYVLMNFNSRVDQSHTERVHKESEVEYILAGTSDPQKNVNIVQGEMVAWRTVFNTVSFSALNTDMVQAIDGFSKALNAGTGVPYPIWKATVTGGLALLESLSDVDIMSGDIKNGKAPQSIPMFKYEMNQLTLMAHLSEVLGGVGIEQLRARGVGTAQGDVGSKNVMVDYKDHLRGMLLYKSLLGQEDATLYRIQDLIYTDVKNSRGEYQPQKHFNFVEVDADFSIKSFFPNLSGIKLQIKGIPVRHNIHVECGRGY